MSFFPLGNSLSVIMSSFTLLDTDITYQYNFDNCLPDKVSHTINNFMSIHFFKLSKTLLNKIIRFFG